MAHNLLSVSNQVSICHIIHCLLRATSYTAGHFHLCGSHAGEHNMKILEHACKSALLAKRATAVCITIVIIHELLQ